ncbi:MAG TPA: M28 family peptidase, partial [Leptolinea sp.]
MYGARVPDSNAHQFSREFITGQLKANGWDVQILEGSVSGHHLYNILATRGTEPIETLFASHYDSRIFADHDPNQNFHSLSVPGANDGGSSAVILLELSRVLPLSDTSNCGLIFFDLEDQGIISGWDWILGSKQYASTTKYLPRQLILLDMV